MLDFHESVVSKVVVLVSVRTIFDQIQGTTKVRRHVRNCCLLFGNYHTMEFAVLLYTRTQNIRLELGRPLPKEDPWRPVGNHSRCRCCDCWETQRLMLPIRSTRRKVGGAIISSWWQIVPDLGYRTQNVRDVCVCDGWRSVPIAKVQPLSALPNLRSEIEICASKICAPKSKSALPNLRSENRNLCFQNLRCH